jgi:hypothetical protein
VPNPSMSSTLPWGQQALLPSRIGDSADGGSRSRWHALDDPRVAYMDEAGRRVGTRGASSGGALSGLTATGSSPGRRSAGDLNRRLDVCETEWYGQS